MRQKKVYKWVERSKRALTSVDDASSVLPPIVTCIEEKQHIVLRTRDTKVSALMKMRLSCTSIMERSDSRIV
jgi:hypothetical protein